MKLAMWRLINGFGTLHNKEQLLHLIDEYADGGGDGGVTLRCVQKSCGLDVELAKHCACGNLWQHLAMLMSKTVRLQSHWPHQC